MNRLTLSIIILLFSPLSLACTCGEVTPKDYFTHCKQLFTATLFTAKISKHDGSAVIGMFRNPKNIMKGDPSKIKGVKTSMNGTSCETNVIVGERYLVCGDDEEYIPVSSCSKTKPTSWFWGRDIIEELNLEKELFNKALKKDANKNSAS